MMRTLLPIFRSLSRFVGLIVLFYAPHALAIGEDVTIGNFSCSNGAATGQLLLSETSCPATLQLTNVFSFMMCNIEQISSNILGHMYCGMINELTPAVWVLATLAVTIFGISFTIGLVPATGREALLFIIKIAFVTGFATNADIIVSYTYTFLIGGMREGVGIVLSGLNVTNAGNGNDTYAMLDNFLYQIFKAATDAIGQTVPEKRCQNAIFSVIVIMVAIFPIFGYLALMLLGRVLLAFYRAVFGYVYAIVGLTFLTILSPFLVPMFWFKQTRTFFDRWLGYLVSFSLQMVLVFASIAFVLSINPKNMVKTLPNVIMYWEESKDTTSFRLPWQYCTLCDFKVVDKDTKKDMDYNDKEIVSKGELQCKIYPVNVPDPIAPDPNLDPTDSNGHAPIRVGFAFTPDKNGNTDSPQMNSLIKLAGYGIVSLIVLAVVLTQVLELMPQLAQNIASSLGASYAAQLGGGVTKSSEISTPDIPGQSLMEDFKTGFGQNLQSSFQDSRTTIQGKRRVDINPKNPPGVDQKFDGIRSGMSSMITGRGKDAAGKETDLYNQQNSPGLDEGALKKKNEGSGLGGAWRKYIGGGF